MTTASPTTSTRWGPRFNLALFIGLGLLCGAWFVRLNSGLAIVLAPLLYAFLASVALTVEVLVLRRRGKVPALPGPLARLEPYLLKICVPVVIVVTLLREGLLAPHFVLTLDWWNATHYANSTWSGSTSFIGSGDAPRFAGRRLYCTLTCHGSDAVCTGIDQVITCNEAGPAQVSIDIDVQVDEPFCYLPLVKSTDGSFSASASISLATAGGSRSGSVQLNGHAGIDLQGVMSCRSFRLFYGREIGKRIAADIDGFLRQN